MFVVSALAGICTGLHPSWLCSTPVTGSNGKHSLIVWLAPDKVQPGLSASALCVIWWSNRARAAAALGLGKDKEAAAVPVEGRGTAGAESGKGRETRSSRGFCPVLEGCAALSTELLLLWG